MKYRMLLPASLALLIFVFSVGTAWALTVKTPADGAVINTSTTSFTWTHSDNESTKIDNQGKANVLGIVGMKPQSTREFQWVMSQIAASDTGSAFIHPKAFSKTYQYSPSLTGRTGKLPTNNYKWIVMVIGPDLFLQSSIRKLRIAPTSLLLPAVQYRQSAYGLTSAKMLFKNANSYSIKYRYAFVFKGRTICSDAKRLVNVNGDVAQSGVTGIALKRRNGVRFKCLHSRPIFKNGGTAYLKIAVNSNGKTTKKVQRIDF